MALRHLVRGKVKIPSYRGEDRRSTPHRDTRHRSRTYHKHSAHSTQGRTSGCHITGGQFRKGRLGGGSVTVHRAIPTKFLFSPMKQRGGTFSGIFPYFRGMLQRGWSGTASRCIPGSRLSDPQKKKHPGAKYQISAPLRSWAFFPLLSAALVLTRA